MANFLSKLFSKLTGGGSASAQQGQEIVNEVLAGIISRAGLNLTFSTSTEADTVHVEFSGDDEAMLTEREGALLDAFQFLLKRVLQHQLPEDRTEVTVDAGGYRESSEQELVDLAEKLRALVLEKGRAVFVRSLLPRDRKVIHRHLAEDDRIKCRSVGEGLYKKIKISLISDQSPDTAGDDAGNREHGGGRPGRGGGARRHGQGAGGGGGRGPRGGGRGPGRGGPRGGGQGRGPGGGGGRNNPNRQPREGGNVGNTDEGAGPGQTRRDNRRDSAPGNNLSNEESQPTGI